MTPAATDVAARLRAMDQLGLAIQIVFPNVPGFAGAGIMRVADEELRRFCTSAYNAAAAEMQAQSGGRLFPQALLPFSDLDAAVKELERSIPTIASVLFLNNGRCIANLIFSGLLDRFPALKLVSVESVWFESDVAGPIRKPGENNLMFETDFPHPTCLYPSPREHVHHALEDLEPRVQRKILYQNAARMYQLTLPGEIR